MSVLAKVVMFIFVAIAVAGFVVVVAMINQNNSAVDATISNSTSAYYDASQQVNQSMNQTLQYGKVATAGLMPIPTLMMIFAIGGACLLFLTVVNKR